MDLFDADARRVGDFSATIENVIDWNKEKEERENQKVLVSDIFSKKENNFFHKIKNFFFKKAKENEMIDRFWNSPNKGKNPYEPTDEEIEKAKERNI